MHTSLPQSTVIVGPSVSADMICQSKRGGLGAGWRIFLSLKAISKPVFYHFKRNKDIKPLKDEILRYAQNDNLVIIEVLKWLVGIIRRQITGQGGEKPEQT
jgi:hypothetical protein